MILVHNGINIRELTYDMLIGMPKDVCFAKGVTSNKNITIIPIEWEAWRLNTENWTIFYIPVDTRDSKTKSRGRKMRAMINVKRLVDCTKRALRQYTY